jgi:hypothetical protein
MDKLKFYLHALKKIDVLIQLQSTGTPAELAKKLKVSIRSLHNYIKFLRTEYNAPIQYDRKHKSYYYKEVGSLELGWRKMSNGPAHSLNQDDCKRLQEENRELKEIFKDIFKYNYNTEDKQSQKKEAGKQQENAHLY